MSGVIWTCPKFESLTVRWDGFSCIVWKIWFELGPITTKVDLPGINLQITPQYTMRQVLERWRLFLGKHVVRQCNFQTVDIHRPINVKQFSKPLFIKQCHDSWQTKGQITFLKVNK